MRFVVSLEIKFNNLKQKNAGNDFLEGRNFLIYLLRQMSSTQLEPNSQLTPPIGSQPSPIKRTIQVHRNLIA